MPERPAPESEADQPTAAERALLTLAGERIVGLERALVAELAYQIAAGEPIVAIVRRAQAARVADQLLAAEGMAERYRQGLATDALIRRTPPIVTPDRSEW